MRFCCSFFPVSRTFAALTTTTKSPRSSCGAKVGLSLPRRIVAICVASRPRIFPSASISRQRRLCSVVETVGVMRACSLSFVGMLTDRPSLYGVPAGPSRKRSGSVGNVGPHHLRNLRRRVGTSCGEPRDWQTSRVEDCVHHSIPLAAALSGVARVIQFHCNDWSEGGSGTNDEIHVFRKHTVKERLSTSCPFR